jgi:tRNA 2-thiouridine synthesizing protein A
MCVLKDNIMETTETIRTIDCSGMNCPMPLLETRKAVIKGKKGEIVRITGDHPNSKFEIPLALESLKCEILEIKDTDGGGWAITFKI